MDSEKVSVLSAEHVDAIAAEDSGDILGGKSLPFRTGGPAFHHSGSDGAHVAFQGTDGLAVGQVVKSSRTELRMQSHREEDLEKQQEKVFQQCLSHHFVSCIIACFQESTLLPGRNPHF